MPLRYGSLAHRTSAEAFGSTNASPRDVLRGWRRSEPAGESEIRREVKITALASAQMFGLPHTFGQPGFRPSESTSMMKLPHYAVQLKGTQRSSRKHR